MPNVMVLGCWHRELFVRNGPELSNSALPLPGVAPRCRSHPQPIPVPSLTANYCSQWDMSERCARAYGKPVHDELDEACVLFLRIKMRLKVTYEELFIYRDCGERSIICSKWLSDFVRC